MISISYVCMRTQRIENINNFLYLILSLTFPSYYLILVLTAALRNATHNRQRERQSEIIMYQSARIRGTRALMWIRREEKGTIAAKREKTDDGAEEKKPEARPRAHLLHSALASMFALLCLPFSICLHGIYSCSTASSFAFITWRNFSSYICIIVTFSALISYVRPTVERLSSRSSSTSRTSCSLPSFARSEQ